MRSRVFGRNWFCVILILTSGAAFSQGVSSDFQLLVALSALPEGQRIRIVSNSRGTLEGDVVAVRSDTLVLHPSVGGLTTFPFADLLAVWQRANSSRHAATIGAIAGAIPGAIIGATMAGIANLDCETQCQDLIGLHLLGGAIGGLMGTAAGVTLGAAVGAAIPAWHQVYAKN